MRSEVVGAVSQSVAFALAMATAGGAGGYRVLHTGAGVARREAYHARRGDERAALDGVDENSLLRAEGATHTIVRVEADSIVVEDEGSRGSKLRARRGGPLRLPLSLSPPQAAPAERQRSTPAPRTSARFPSVPTNRALTIDVK